MRRLTLTRLGPGHKARRALALLTLVALCVTLVLTCAGASLAADEGRTIDTPGGATITTSQGMEAPQLDYKFVWWSFILTFGLLIVYYVWILRISDKEFKKIIDAHFGPKQDGR
jgi:hypothetical protein